MKVSLKDNTHLVRESVMNVLNNVQDGKIVRVHRSWAINLRYVRASRLKGSSKAKLTMDSGESIPVSRYWRKQVAEALNKLGASDD